MNARKHTMNARYSHKLKIRKIEAITYAKHRGFREKPLFRGRERVLATIYNPQPPDPNEIKQNSTKQNRQNENSKIIKQTTRNKEQRPKNTYLQIPSNCTCSNFKAPLQSEPLRQSNGHDERQSNGPDTTIAETKGREDPTVRKRPRRLNPASRHSSTVRVAFTRGRKRRSGLSLQVTSAQTSSKPSKISSKFLDGLAMRGISGEIRGLIINAQIYLHETVTNKPLSTKYDSSIHRFARDLKSSTQPPSGYIWTARHNEQPCTTVWSTIIKMARTPSCDKNGMRKGTWTAEEDRKLIAYVSRYGCWNWRQLPKFAGLSRCGKSCRLRWMNYLRPNIKRGNFTQQEEDLIIRMHKKLGNRWSTIAAELPGRTDNEVKNHWHTSLTKRVQNNTITNIEETKSKLIIESTQGMDISSLQLLTPQVNSQDTNGPLSPFSSSSELSSSTSSDQSTTHDFDDFGFLDAFMESMDQSFWLDDLSEIVQDNTIDAFLVSSNHSSIEMPARRTIGEK
ncbi:hypothetical protein TSUD_270180 [Trifolium subterraneum]|uniref:Uncharacterized protein n=1 Tax=Trifolium subterraneum TaxID=3900 RepID=A0A2Z6P8I6_TRISU|nr:hypothetical protein TSUD_270180 [Trifolium subterraneum]